MDEAAELLHVHVRTVYRMQERGDLPTVYLGRTGARAGRRLVKRDAIDAFIDASEEVIEMPPPKPRKPAPTGRPRKATSKRAR